MNWLRNFIAWIRYELSLRRASRKAKSLWDREDNPHRKE